MIQTAFNGGELTPLAHGRPELAIYPTACETLRNCRALLHGGFTRDPGLEHLGKPLSNARARLLPFEFSAADRFILELTATKCRVWTTGDTPAVTGATTTHPFAADELREIHTAQINDLVFFTQGSHPPQLLTRTAPTTFAWDDFAFRHHPLLDQNDDPTHTLTYDGATTLNSSSALFDAGHVGAVFEIAHQRTLAERRVIQDLTTNATTASIVVDGEFVIQTYGNWIALITVQQSDDGGATWEDILFYESTSGALANFSETHETPAQVLLRLVVSGASGSGSPRKVVLTASDPYIRNTLQIDSFTSATEVEVTPLTLQTLTSATPFWSEGAFSDYRGYPSAVVFHRQRLIFGGTSHQPQKLWGSRIDNYDDFREPTGTDEAADPDSAFSLNVISTSQNRITYLSSQKELVIGTTAGEFAAVGDQQTGSFTEGDITIIPLSHFGSDTLQPIDSEIGLIFLQRGARAVRHVGALIDVLYTPPELDQLSLFGEHLTRSGVLEHAYARTPDPVYWCITGDGRLAGYTHKPDQRVLAWHSHDLGPTVAVESLAVAYSDSEEDQLWLCLAHTPPGGATVRTLERFALGQREAQETEDWNAFRYLHHHRSYAATAATPLTVTDFAHLDGRELTVTLNGHPLTTVTASASFEITAPIDGTLLIGCAYTSRATTLPPLIQTRSGPLFLTHCQIGRIRALPYLTGALQASTSASPAARDFPSRPVTVDFDTFPPLLNAPLVLDGLGGHTPRPSITLQTSSPWPMTIRALLYHIEPNETP